jgi:hypothetical protein
MTRHIKGLCDWQHEFQISSEGLTKHTAHLHHHLNFATASPAPTMNLEHIQRLKLPTPQHTYILIRLPNHNN